MSIRCTVNSILGAVLVATFATPAFAGSDPEAVKLLTQVVNKVGSMSQLHKRRDVEYTYMYRDAEKKMDLSIERYIFDGEHSWAQYVVHEKNVSPGVSGDVIQSKVGDKVAVSIDGKPTTDKKILSLAAFLRPTNYYWFAMMPKLLDPGVQAKLAGKRTVDGVEYKMVDVTFGSENTDRYLLYINPKTYLIDRFLFSVVDFGVMAKPLLMKVSYENVDGLLLPTRRVYTPANSWESGEPESDKWVEETMMNIRFRNGFKKSDLSL